MKIEVDKGDWREKKVKKRYLPKKRLMPKPEPRNRMPADWRNRILD